MHKTFHALTISFLLLSTASLAGQQAKLIGVGSLPGTTADQSQLTDQLSDATPHNTFGGISGLEYQQEKGTFLAISDRGPKDGAVDWHCRFHELKINISSNSVSTEVQSSILLKDSQQRPFTGRSTAYSPNQTLAERFDPEAIRVMPNGNYLVSDEYGPQLIEFTSTGEEVRRIPVPLKLLIRNLGPDKSLENGRNRVGRSCNRGMEGIAISPDGKSLVGLMQSSLLQDSIRDASGNPNGHNVRLIKFDLQTGQQHEYVYEMETTTNKLHEILSINDHEFLVLENDGEVGDASNYKRVYRIDIRNATDVRSVAQLPWKGLPTSIKPVAKELFIDMRDERFGLKNTLPEKVEGLTWGPTVDGSKTLIVASDNDFDSNVQSQFFVFQVDVTKPVSVTQK